MDFKVAYFSFIYSPVRSGPGRLSEHLGAFASSSSISFTCFTDSMDKIPFKDVIHVKSIPLLNKMPGYWLFRSYLYYKLFNKHKANFDILLCSNAFEAAFLVFFEKSIPVIVMINDDNYIYTKTHFNSSLRTYSLRKALSRYLGYFLERHVARRATQVIACSEYLKKQLLDNYKIDKTRITVIYPSVDIEAFRCPQKTYFNKSEIQVLFVKNDWRRGGLDTIIEGLSGYKGIRKIHLNVVGILKNEIQQINGISKKYSFKGKISIWGILEKEKLKDKFCNADVFISASRQEAFGISILEALATSTPVIATKVGGIPEILKDNQGGFLIEPESPEQLTKIFSNLISDPMLVEPQINQGLVICRKFSKNNLYSSLEDLIISLVRKDK